MKFLLPLFVFVLPCITKAQKSPDLKGRVKAVTETYTSVSKFPGMWMEITQTVTHKYNEQGKLSEILDISVHRDSTSNIADTNTNREVYTYNDKGQLINLRKVSSSRINGEHSSLSEYVQDDAGRRIMEIYTPDEKKNKRNLYAMSYNEHGKLTEIISLAGSEGNSEFKEIGRQKNSYDLEGNVAETFYYDYNTKKYNLAMTAVYNGQRNPIERKYFYTDGSLRTSHTYLYNKEGKLVEETTTEGGGRVIKAAYTYESPDDKGNYLVYTISGKEMSEPMVRERTIEYYE